MTIRPHSSEHVFQARIGAANSTQIKHPYHRSSLSKIFHETRFSRIHCFSLSKMQTIFTPHTKIPRKQTECSMNEP